MTQIIDACNHTIVQFTTGPLLQGNPVAAQTLDGSDRPTSITYNLKNGTQEIVTISYPSDVLTINGIAYPNHLLNVYNATLEAGTPHRPTDQVVSATLQHWYRMGDGDTAPIIIDNVGSNDGTMNNMDGTNFTGDVP